MIENENLICLDELMEECKAKKILISGIGGKIKLHTMNSRTNNYQVLSVGELQEICNVHPKKKEVYLVKPIYRRTHLVEIGHRQNINYKDLWVNKNDYENIISSPNTITDAARSYSTPEIEAMFGAIDHFWIDYDPEHPPKKDIVVDWFEKKGLSARVAAVIDSMIRPPQYRGGGNRSRQKLKG